MLGWRARDSGTQASVRDRQHEDNGASERSMVDRTGTDPASFSELLAGQMTKFEIAQFWALWPHKRRNLMVETEAAKLSTEREPHRPRWRQTLKILRRQERREQYGKGPSETAPPLRGPLTS